MSFTNRTSAATLNYIFGRTSDFDTQPTLHVGLSTADPGDTGASLAEPSGNGYARVATNSTVWDDATVANPSVLDNGSAINFPSPTGSWGTVTHFVIFDALTNGNVIASGALGSSRSIQSGDSVSFPAGDLSVTLT